MKCEQLRDGDLTYPVMRGYKIVCCDCGLAHRINFFIEGRRLSFTVARDNRATAAFRRKKR